MDIGKRDGQGISSVLNHTAFISRGAKCYNKVAFDIIEEGNACGTPWLRCLNFNEIVQYLTEIGISSQFLIPHLAVLVFLAMQF